VRCRCRCGGVGAGVVQEVAVVREAGSGAGERCAEEVVQCRGRWCR